MNRATTITDRHAGVGRAFVGVVAAIGSAVRAVRREMEIARARRHMANLPDSLLKDIGIDRLEIDLAARYGRREHGRRYL